MTSTFTPLQRVGAHSRPVLSEDISVNQPVVISQDRPIPISSPGPVEIIAFSDDGIAVLRNMLHIHLRSLDTYSEFDSHRGWRTDKHVRLLGDITGNGSADIVGFGEGAVWVCVNKNDNTFSMPAKQVLSGFCYSDASGGWRVDKHIRYLADLRNIGRCDIIGFGEDGVFVSLNKGGGEFKAPTLVLEDFGYKQGWRLEKHLRFLADVTGDGLLDIIGFGDTHVYVSRNSGDGTFETSKPVLEMFTHDAGGWRIEGHPRFVVDLTGDGNVDILGCADAGIVVALNDRNGGFKVLPIPVAAEFGQTQGWSVDKHPRYVADLTGNKRPDFIGFGEAGVYVAYSNGDGTFQPAKLVLSDFCIQQGWLVQKNPRFVVDLTGNGCADILGFGDDAVWASFNDGKGGFGPKKKVIDGFAYSGSEGSLNTMLRYVISLGGRA